MADTPDAIPAFATAARSAILAPMPPLEINAIGGRAETCGGARHRRRSSVEKGMEEKPREFTGNGSELYAKA